MASVPHGGLEQGVQPPRSVIGDEACGFQQQSNRISSDHDPATDGSVALRCKHLSVADDAANVSSNETQAKTGRLYVQDDAFGVEWMVHALTFGNHAMALRMWSLKVETESIWVPVFGACAGMSSLLHGL
jgi:hypothetical protein